VRRQQDIGIIVIAVSQLLFGSIPVRQCEPPDKSGEFMPSTDAAVEQRFGNRPEPFS
jgi:hypothetical protein